MPGILGIIAKNHSRDETPLLRAMVRSMMHESFYHSTEYIDSDHGLYLAAICITDSFADCMPIVNESKDLTVLFSGELFTDEKNSSLLSSQTLNNNDASYIIHHYEKDSESFFHRCNGWFSGVIANRNNGEVILFNDRYGMQRVYIYESNDTFFFSSEAKALLVAQHPSVRSINPQSMGEYLCFDCVLNNKTYFNKIDLLPGGSKWTFVHGSLRKERYFNPAEWESQDILPRDILFPKLQNTFSGILPRYFSGKKTIGMALTGGLDTRMILSCMHPKPGTLPCFTFGGMYRDSLDVRVSRRVANACGQSHQTIQLGSEFLNNYPSFITRAIYLSDGLTNATNADEHYLNGLVRQIATIKMTGKFGSQVMRGLAGLRERLPDERLIHDDFKSYTKQALEIFSNIKKDHSLSFFLFSEIPWYWSGFTVSEFSQLCVRSPYLDNDFVKLLYQAPSGVLSSPEFQWDFICNTFPELGLIRTDKGMGGKKIPIVSTLIKYGYVLPGIADKVYVWDRLPYSLTHRIARLDNYTKSLHVASLFRGIGYFRHYRIWFRDQLSSYIREILLDPKTLQRPFWNKKYIEKIVFDHICGRGNYMLEIRKALTIELIHRTLIEDLGYYN